MGCTSRAMAISLLIRLRWITATPIRRLVRLMGRRGASVVGLRRGRRVVAAAAAAVRVVLSELAAWRRAVTGAAVPGLLTVAAALVLGSRGAILAVLVL